jgi:hypothetical protein
VNDVDVCISSEYELSCALSDALIAGALRLEAVKSGGKYARNSVPERFVGDYLNPAAELYSLETLASRSPGN